MKCEICGKAPWDGYSLFRQNPKGEVGIWRCEEHNKAPVDEDVAELVKIIEGSQQ